jgi:SAM-dependent methyltransferase
MADRDVWEEEAKNWITWARTPGHDAYWRYREAFFDQILPSPKGATLEVGCGEGRVTRDLAARGHKVTAVDVSPTLIQHARDADQSSRYEVADAVRLPFEDGTFDLVVAYNSLMDVDDMPGAIREAARVLKPGGHFCFCVTHPLADSGRFQTREADAVFVITGSYLERRFFDETESRAGLSVRFRGWCSPLQDYARALEEAGFVIERIREPEMPQQAVREDPAQRRWQRLPLFLMVRAVSQDSLK